MFDLDVVNFDGLKVDGGAVTAAEKAWESKRIGE